MSVKKCTKCKEEKPRTLEHFPLHNKVKDGLDSWCRKCRATYRSETRRGRYRSSIGDDKLKMILDTTHECVICGIEFKKFKDKKVDHCHKTGQVRGILCDNCNMGLGKFKDSPQLLEYARIYLLDSVNDKEAEEYVEKYFAESC